MFNGVKMKVQQPISIQEFATSSHMKVTQGISFADFANNCLNNNMNGCKNIVANNSANEFSETTQNKEAIIVTKGQRYNLSSHEIDSIYIGLGWDLPTDARIAYDLDSEIFMLGKDGKVISDDYFIFYGQTSSPDGSCNHLADNLTGEGMGDDEVIQIELSKINPSVEKLAIVITINDAIENDQRFGEINNAYVRVMDGKNNKEILRFNLTDYPDEVRSLTVGEIYKKDGTWRFNALGQGLDTDLAGLCRFYGVNLV